MIDYMMRYHNTNAKHALAAVNDLFAQKTVAHPIVEVTTKPISKTNPLEILSVKEVFSKALFQYLESRKISPDIGLQYLKQG